MYVMAQHGKQIGLYLQKELEDRIDSLVAQNRDVWKSRNHFINCAIVIQLRSCEENGIFCKAERAAKERDNGRLEQGQEVKQEEVGSPALFRYRDYGKADTQDVGATLHSRFPKD